ncbi:MAG: HlyC/CorC family transporter [Gammaproteobacteria bacterium]
MDAIPLGVLFGALVFLIVLSGFFSGSETGLMMLNRYRLRHLARARHPGAMRAQRLLERPDRLIGLILLGNNFANIVASSLATIIGLRLMGETGIVVATVLLTLAVLIFSEVAPKTLAALHPERVAFPASYVYVPLLKVLYPLVWVVNAIANSLLRIAGVSPDAAAVESISSEELRTVVLEAGAMIPKRHQRMLLNLLDLEKATVEDIMIPRNEIVGIDINEPDEEIMAQIIHSQYTRLPVFEESIDNVIGLVHLRNALPLVIDGHFHKSDLREVMREPYFIPEGATLNRQMLNFQRERRRIGLVVDEYGDIQGLVTLEDILEEIVGEFTTDPSATIREIIPQHDGSFLVDAGASIREINRALQVQLPTTGPKTLNGLILEYMETIPEPGTSLLLNGYPVDIVQTKDNAVKTARLHPALRRTAPDNESL